MNNDKRTELVRRVALLLRDTREQLVKIAATGGNRIESGGSTCSGVWLQTAEESATVASLLEYAFGQFDQAERAAVRRLGADFRVFELKNADAPGEPISEDRRFCAGFVILVGRREVDLLQQIIDALDRVADRLDRLKVTGESA